MNYRYKSGNKNFKFNRIRRFGKSKDVSVILPTYNEQECIGNIIKLIRKILKGKKYEIVIVDDNSKDKTPEIIDSYKSDNIVALHRYNKRGILSAFIDGAIAARGNIIIMMDADMSLPPEKIPELLKYAEDYDLVVCSRFTKGGGSIAPSVKKYSAEIFNFVIKALFSGTGITDFTSGFYAIKRDKFLDIKFKYPAIFGEFGIELLYSAYKKGYKIKEIPYVYKYRELGKSKAGNILKYGIVYWKSALKVRFLG